MKSLSSAVLAALLAAGAALQAAADPGVATHEPVVDKVSPAIVAIQCKSPPRKGLPQEMGWFGTGTVISEDGAILTSTTVVPPDVKTDSIEVSFTAGKKLKCQFVCASAELEIAMIRLPKGKYPFVPMGNSKDLKLGHVVYTFGNCQNVMENDDEVAFAQGEVSGFYKITDVFEGKQWYDWCTYKGDVIETTAPLNPGVDGGPLIDAHGKLVGIMSLSYNETRWLGVAVPQAVLAERVGKWLKGEAVKDGPKVEPKEEDDDDAPFLGATLQADEPVIAEIAKGSPAAKGKLKVGDRIVSIDGKEMKSPASVLKSVKSHVPGDEVMVIVLRDGEKLTFKIKLGFQPM